MKTKKNCYLYNKCENVPCGESMNKCKPSYCVPISRKRNITSRNWSYCNMANWKNKNYKFYKKKCLSEKNCKLKKSKKTNNTVDVLTLHKKMPYIWRYLKPKTRKHMVNLANKKIKDINIPFTLFPDFKYDKRFVNKNKGLKKLRVKYKDI